MNIKPFVVAVAQFAPKLADLDSNLQMHLDKAEQAIQLGADVIVFPELSLTGYLLKDLVADVAINVDKPDKYLDALKEMSKKISILFGFVQEADNYVYYNSAAFLEAGEIRHIHQKVYLPTYGMFDEERYFSPGGVFRTFNSKFGPCGILVCEDYWHPSSTYLLAQDGAVVHFYLSNAPLRGLTLPDEITSIGIAENMALTSSQLYSVYTVFANRTGYEDGVCFSGNSKIISPTGAVIARAGEDTDEILLAEIDPEQIRRARTFFPLLGDEKIDMVQRELNRIINKRFNLEE